MIEYKYINYKEIVNMRVESVIVRLVLYISNVFKINFSLEKHHYRLLLPKM